MIIEMGSNELKLVFEGECARCGNCCINLVKMPHMLNERGICKYLMPEKNGQQLCKIQAARQNKDVIALRSIPQRDIDYFRRSCNHFPSQHDDAAAWIRSVLPRFTQYCAGYRVQIIQKSTK